MPQHVSALCHPLVNGQSHLTDLSDTMNESDTHILKNRNCIHLSRTVATCAALYTQVELDDVAGCKVLLHFTPGAVKKLKKLRRQWLAPCHQE